MAAPTIFAANNAHTFQLAGSLTTVFTPAPSCFSYIDDNTPETFRLAGAELPGCFPTNMSLFFVKTTAAYYSPARCPASHTPYRVTDSISGVTTVSSPTNMDILDSGNHVFYCCPYPLIPDDTVDRGCVTSITGQATVSVHGLLSGGAYNPTPTETVLSGTANYKVVGYGVQIRFKNADLKELSFDDEDMRKYGLVADSTGSASVSETAGTSASGTARKSKTSSSPSAQSSNNSHDALAAQAIATGLKIAIGICVPLFVLLLIGGLAAFWILRKKKSRRAPHFPPGPPDEEYMYQQQGAYQQQGQKLLPAYPTSEIMELPPNVRVNELPTPEREGRGPRHELMG